MSHPTATSQPCHRAPTRGQEVAARTPVRPDRDRHRISPTHSIPTGDRSVTPARPAGPSGRRPPQGEG